MEKTFRYRTEPSIIPDEEHLTAGLVLGRIAVLFQTIRGRRE